MELVLIGAGQRGMIYATYAHERGIRIAAVAEADPERRAAACAALDVPENRSYADAAALLSQERMADAAILATMDRDHCTQAIAAMEKGYDLLLEKPVSPVPSECVAIAEKAKTLGRRVMVCHVLRYAPFFREIKKIIDSGELGRVMTIQHNENIGNFHMAHSFVRGNWRSSEQSSPIMMQKSCHDMDLLVWLTGSECSDISSFGSLSYFRSECAPENAARRCVDCPLKDSCRFSAYLAYLPVRGGWPATVLTADQSEEGLRKAIAEGPYGRCVYYCDNNVCDHQVTCMTFANGVTATFNLSAFTNRMARTMKIMCENGEIRASEYENRIEVVPFATTGAGQTDARLITPMVPGGFHGGGDAGIMEDFLAVMEGRQEGAATDIARSVESHLMASAAEEARATGTVIHMSEYRRRLTGGCAE